jgi:hypothetical protein
MDWSEFYPALTSEELSSMRVRIADVGCGFGGLTGTATPFCLIVAYICGFIVIIIRYLLFLIIAVFIIYRCHPFIPYIIILYSLFLHYLLFIL